MNDLEPDETIAAPAEQLPGSFRPRSRNSALLLGMLVVFSCGIVTGGGLTLYYEQQRMHGFLKHPEAAPSRIVSGLRRRLELSDEQVVQVQEIIQRHHAALEKIRAELHPRFSIELDQLEKEVAAVLTKEQKTRWIERFRNMRENCTPAAPQSEGSPTEVENAKQEPAADLKKLPASPDGESNTIPGQPGASCRACASDTRVCA